MTKLVFLCTNTHIDGAFVQVTTRRRFNRSLTEVRPDAYIFDEGTHFEVVPLPEEPDEVVKSREALNEQVVRKASMQSEADSDIYLPLSQRPSTCETVKRTPYVTVRQDTGASTESKDTLTPMGNDDDQTLVGGDNSDDAAPDINFEGNFLAVQCKSFLCCVVLALLYPL